MPNITKFGTICDVNFGKTRHCLSRQYWERNQTQAGHIPVLLHVEDAFEACITQTDAIFCSFRTLPSKSRSRRSMCRGKWSPYRRRAFITTDKCSEAHPKHPCTRLRRQSCRWNSSHRSSGGMARTRLCVGARYPQSSRC